MDFETYDNFLIVDLEASCCNDNQFPTTEMEIIEVGAVMVEAQSLTKIDEFCTFIKPIRHPQLTSFCTELTSINQQDVDTAPLFKDAVNQFKQWLYQYENYLFCSWGDYDKAQLEQDCRLHKEPYPIPAPHLNIKKAFSASQGINKRQGMAQALNLAGIPLEGRHHRGIDDARNMAKLMPYILGRKFI